MERDLCPTCWCELTSTDRHALYCTQCKTPLVPPYDIRKQLRAITLTVKPNRKREKQS
jgi:RNase P subunit RPR2